MLKVRTSVSTEPSTRTLLPRSDGPVVRFIKQRKSPQLLDGLGIDGDQTQG
jgi:hypothetical protein